MEGRCCGGDCASGEQTVNIVQLFQSFASNNKQATNSTKSTTAKLSLGSFVRRSPFVVRSCVRSLFVRSFVRLCGSWSHLGFVIVAFESVPFGRLRFGRWESCGGPGRRDCLHCVALPLCALKLFVSHSSIDTCRKCCQSF